MCIRKHSFLKIAWFAGVLVLLNMPIAQAATPPCGTTLTKNTRLDADMNCPGTALRLTGKKSNKVTLNCAGHSITTVDGSAIIGSDVSSVTIKNCNISTSTYFSHGVLLTGTARSTVKDNNIMTSGDSSRGISLRDSSNNKITGNTVHATGVFAHGILARAGSNNNLVKSNALETDISYPVNIQSSSNNKIYDNILMGPNGYVFSRSFSLQTGGLGVDTSGNIYAIENNWGSSDGIGTATAFFMVDPVTGLGNSVLPVTMGGKDIDFGFDALDVLPNGTILALPGSGPAPSLYEIDPISGHATAIPLNILLGSGKLNGLEATSDTSLLATTNTGGLLNVDLNTGNVTEIGQQGTGWTDVAVHPTNGKAYTVSRRRDEASNTAHLYEINPGTGQIITEIGDTGEVGLSSIDFALDGTLYGNADGVLIEINPADASVTSVNMGGFGPDPLEPMPKKNKLKGNLFQNADGSLLFPDTITLPTAIEIDISSALVDIGPNRVMVDSAVLPFLDEPAQITLNNITGSYHNLLVDPEDDGSFEPCASPQCKFVGFHGGSLVFDVKGFTSYSSEENTDPTFEFVATVILAEINALKNDPAVSKSARKKLKAAAKKLAKALKFLKNPNFKNVKKALSQIEKTAKDLVKAVKKAPAATVPLDRLVEATGTEAQDAIDVAIAAGGSAGFIAQAQVHIAKAEELIVLDNLDKAVEIYILAWITAQIAVQDTEVSQIQFADSNLKACVEALAITRPTDITHLSCTEMGIVDITGIEKLPNLVWLNLSYNQISDISQLATLTKLVVLSLGDQTASNNLLNTSPANNISNLAPLSSLTKLTDLKLNKNDITDLGPLSMLTQLEHLELSGNGIVDLGPLSSLTKLRHLSLGYTAMGGNQISDLVPLSALTKLNILYLNSNLISDITPLSSLVNLVDLRLSDNNISDIGSLSSLTNLTTLSLGEKFYGGNNIVDLTPLSSLTKLNLLFLSNNNISDINALNTLVNLVSLGLVGNNISDISALASLNKLTSLSLGEHRFGGNNISDVSPLAALTELTSLDLDDNNIANISSLASLTKLQWLSVSGNNISNLNAIGNLTEIVNLFLEDNAISDIGPLSSLTKVRFLSLGGTISGNNISNLAPLSSMINLNDLRLDNNIIGDLTPLAGLVNLTSLNLRNNAITAIAPLASLTNLNWMDLGKNSIANISPLTSLTKLGTLTLDENNISDVSPLAVLTNLNWLALGDNLINDVSALASLTNLSTLTLYDNNVNAGVTDLVSLIRLVRLDLQRNINIFCADLATLVGVLGTAVVMEPASCI